MEVISAKELHEANRPGGGVDYFYRNVKAMKSAITRVTIRPGKSVAVSSEAMARARGALEAFGVTEADLERLARFKGDVTIGPAAKRGV